MSQKQETSSSIPMPVVKDSTEKNNVLNFTLENTNVSIANALRRTILSDIDTVVMDPKDSNFIINTTRFNNEILKQRLGCVPIHITDFEGIENLMIEVDESNETDSIKFVTTKNFKIKDTSNDKYLSEQAVREIFPTNSITDCYILFARLRPRVTNEIPGERLKFECKLSLNKAKVDGMYNVASTCAYGNTPDRVEQGAKWQEQEDILEQKGLSSTEIRYARENWYTLQAKRHFLDNSFDFKIQSIGVFTNLDLIHKACDIINNKLRNIAEMCDNESLELMKNTTAVKNTYDVKLVGYSYTIGKVIEYILHTDYYKDSAVFSYVGFIKRHPHDDFSILRFSFINDSEFTEGNSYRIIKYACLTGINIFQNLKEFF